MTCLHFCLRLIRSAFAFNQSLQIIEYSSDSRYLLSRAIDRIEFLPGNRYSANEKPLQMSWLATEIARHCMECMQRGQASDFRTCQNVETGDHCRTAGLP